MIDPIDFMYSTMELPGIYINSPLRPSFTLGWSGKQGASNTKDSVLALASAAEAASEHPVGRAVTEAARARGFSKLEPTVEGFQATPGMGVSCTIVNRGSGTLYSEFILFMILFILFPLSFSLAIVQETSCRPCLGGTQMGRVSVATPSFVILFVLHLKLICRVVGKSHLSESWGLRFYQISPPPPPPFP